MSLTAQQFNISSLEIAIFSNKDNELSPTKILGTVLGEFQSRYDGEVQSLPLPVEAPSEIPRITMISSNNEYRLHCATSRIDSFWYNIGKQYELKEITENVAQPLSKLITNLNLSIGRYALVIERTIEVEKAAEYLADKFCDEGIRKGPIKRSDSFEIHNHKKFDLRLSKDNSIKVNSWVRCKNIVSNYGKEMIWVQQDINTLHEVLPSKKFSNQDFVSFYKAATKEAESIMSLYF